MTNNTKPDDTQKIEPIVCKLQDWRFNEGAGDKVSKEDSVSYTLKIEPNQNPESGVEISITRDDYENDDCHCYGMFALIEISSGVPAISIGAYEKEFDTTTYSNNMGTLSIVKPFATYDHKPEWKETEFINPNYTGLHFSAASAENDPEILAIRQEIASKHIQATYGVEINTEDFSIENGIATATVNGCEYAVKFSNKSFVTVVGESLKKVESTTPNYLQLLVNSIHDDSTDDEYPRSLNIEVTHELLDKVNNMQSALKAVNLLRVSDTLSNVAGSTFWSNDVYPDAKGFKRITESQAEELKLSKMWEKSEVEMVITSNTVTFKPLSYRKPCETETISISIKYLNSLID